MKRLTAERNCEIAFYNPVYCKFSNKNYIRNVLKRDIVSPVCNDDYYNSGTVDEDTLKQIYVKLGEIENIMKVHAIESVEYLEQCIKRSDKYGELAEKIGCPIEVRCKIFKEQVVYLFQKFTNELKLAIVDKVEEHEFTAVVEDRNGYPIETFICSYDDHKKFWWLNKDKSE